jgi:hypothetical protein
MHITDIVVKAFSLCVLIYIVAKVLAPFLGETFYNMFFGTKKKKNSDINFDHMIEQKKVMLRGDGSEGPSAQGAAGPSKRKGRTEEALHDEYTSLSQKKARNPADEKRYSELKTFMAMIDSLQWGAGPELKTIATKISSLIGSRLSETDLNKTFVDLLKREVFLKTDGKLKGLSDINNAIESYAYLKVLIEKPEVQQAQAKKWTMKPDSVTKGLAIYLAQKKSEAKLKELIKSPYPKLPQPESTLLISVLKGAQGKIKSRLEVANEIKEEAELFHTLSPLPPLKGKNDREGALKSLGLSGEVTAEQIKKQYKKLARLKHPDRLKGKGIPAEFESIATENFTQIKEAYDILIKDS